MSKIKLFNKLYVGSKDAQLAMPGKSVVKVDADGMCEATDKQAAILKSMGWKTPPKDKK